MSEALPDEINLTYPEYIGDSWVVRQHPFLKALEYIPGGRWVKTFLESSGHDGNLKINFPD